MNKQVYICILTHNAPKYVWKTLSSIHNITKLNKDTQIHIAVWDNASSFKTRIILAFCRVLGWINSVSYSEENLLFAGGNNKISEQLPPPSKDNEEFVLLLNSDVEVKSSDWLEKLLNRITTNTGAISYGACLNDPVRADGYCILIRRGLYDKYKMDEDFQWFWSMTKLEANILKEGYNIIAIENHEDQLHHFGGKSGTGWQGAKGMDVDMNEVLSWFKSEDSGKVVVVPSINSKI